MDVIYTVAISIVLNWDENCPNSRLTRINTLTDQFRRSFLKLSDVLRRAVFLTSAQDCQPSVGLFLYAQPSRGAAVLSMDLCCTRSAGGDLEGRRLLQVFFHLA